MPRFAYVLSLVRPRSNFEIDLLEGPVNSPAAINIMILLSSQSV